MTGKEKKLITIGTIGTITFALCCFTPVLLILLGSVGLLSASANAPWIDTVLIPLLIASILLLGIGIYILIRRKTANRNIDQESSNR